MKRHLLRISVFAIAFFCSLSAVGNPQESSQDFRRIYIARHGQRPSKGDSSLTDLAKEQARMLGERLKAEGFKGNIYASPYLRTVETAVEIAKVTGGKVALNPLIQERTHKLGSPDIKGRTQSELSKIFPGMILDSPKLEYPWVYTDNSGEKLKENVEKAIQEALKADGRDFILVGHKATVKAALEILGKQAGVQIEAEIWNCTLLYFVISDSGSVKFVECGTGFIPPQKITNNQKPPLLTE